MDRSLQQEALNLLAEAAQRLSNHAQGRLSQETAMTVMLKIQRFLALVEDQTGMHNIPEPA